MEIGQRVRLRRLRERPSPEVIKRLGTIGVIEDFKMTDGKGIGVIVRFDDKFSSWFFEDEVEVVG